MKATGWLPLTSDEHVISNIKRWETGRATPSVDHQQILARVFGVATFTLFGPEATDPGQLSTVDLGGTLARLGRSDVTASTLLDLEVAVDQLCTAYSTDPPADLLAATGRWLVEIDRALAGRVSAEATIELRRSAAWLALLAGCLANDLGDRVQADRARVTARHLAEDAGDLRAVAWSHEMLVWFSLTDGELGQALAAAAAGIDAAPASDVAVQLLGQQAETMARLGQLDAARRSLEQARGLLDTLPYPDNPRNHFTVDPQKFRKPVMRVARLVGDGDLARHQAEEIIAAGTRPDGSHRQPMRVADAKATIACVAAAGGDLDEAYRLTGEALAVERVSKPSLQLVISEVVSEFPAGDRRATDLREHLFAI